MVLMIQKRVKSDKSIRSHNLYIHLHFYQSDYRKIYNYSILHLYCVIYSLDETDSV
jgi:hypothetical protein